MTTKLVILMLVPAACDDKTQPTGPMATGEPPGTGAQTQQFRTEPSSEEAPSTVAPTSTAATPPLSSAPANACIYHAPEPAPTPTPTTDPLRPERGLGLIWPSTTKSRPIKPWAIALGPFGPQSIMKPVSKLAGFFRAWGAQRQATRDVESFLRLHFLYSATKTGLLKSLETPTSKQEWLEKLSVRRPLLLDRFLALGFMIDCR